MRKTTITDIAKSLHVTPSTVSRALADNARVSAATRKLVWDKAAELGYARNRLASSLRKGTSEIVGMVVPRINREFFANVISGAEAMLNPAGYHLMICQSHERVSDEGKAIQTLLQSRVSGILISHSLETLTTSHLQAIVDTGCTLIQFDRVFKSLPGAKVFNDNFSGAYLATRHLLKEGYKRIGHLSGSASTAIYHERMEGYRHALLEWGMAPSAALVVENAITREAALNTMPRLLAMGCDALYCAGDLAALGAMEYCKHHGIEIPKHMGIVGTANETFGALIEPSLTSIEQNAFDMGKQAAIAFLEAQNKPCDPNKETVVPMRLIVRDSSVAAKYIHAIEY